MAETDAAQVQCPDCGKTQRFFRLCTPHEALRPPPGLRCLGCMLKGCTMTEAVPLAANQQEPTDGQRT